MAKTDCVVYTAGSQKCPSCGHAHFQVLSASTPAIYRCCSCESTWNPDSRRPVSRETFGFGRRLG